MKRLLFIVVLFSCSGDPPPPMPVSTDISVSKSVSTIDWVDKNDLVQLLQSAFTYDLGLAAETEVEKVETVNNDSTEVTAIISFSDDFADSYTDTNPWNNTASISLVKHEPTNATVLSANGPGDTYELITSVLAPGNNPIEVPDCNHASFGDHIDEVFNNDLAAHVFRFFIHTDPDNDRCINFDRQRNEIKTYDKSPADLKGAVGETVVYKWKFKLPSGFQSSPNFTHIHQLKSVGGSLASMPMYTLTTRKGSPDQLELRYAQTDSQVTLKKTDLAPFLDEWVEVTETIKYGTSGTYEIRIKKAKDETVLFEYSNNSIVNWRPNASFVRPKWGIYRSLNNAQDLRDEVVLFADFSIEEL